MLEWSPRALVRSEPIMISRRIAWCGTVHAIRFCAIALMYAPRKNHARSMGQQRNWRAIIFIKDRCPKVLKRKQELRNKSWLL